jgi:hypothetical protein
MPGFTDIELIDRLFQVTGVLDTVYGHATTHTRLQSEAADHITWERYASYATSGDDNSALTSSLSRIQFSKLKSPLPLHAINKAVSSQVDLLAENKTRLFVVVGRSRRLAVEDHHAELKQLMEEHGSVASEVQKTVGDVATACLVAGYKAGIVVLQAAHVAVD